MYLFNGAMIEAERFNGYGEKVVSIRWEKVLLVCGIDEIIHPHRLHFLKTSKKLSIGVPNAVTSCFVQLRVINIYSHKY